MISDQCKLIIITANFNTVFALALQLFCPIVRLWVRGCFTTLLCLCCHTTHCVNWRQQWSPAGPSVPSCSGTNIPTTTSAGRLRCSTSGACGRIGRSWLISPGKACKNVLKDQGYTSSEVEEYWREIIWISSFQLHVWAPHTHRNTSLFCHRIRCRSLCQPLASNLFICFLF